VIALQNSDGELLKVLQNHKQGQYGWHSLFGLISVEAATKRIDARKRDGFEYSSNEWKCKFDIINNEVKAISNCEVTKEEDKFELVTPLGTFYLTKNLESGFHDYLTEHEDGYKWLNKLTEYAFILTFILIPIIAFMGNDKPVTEEEEKKELEKIVVKVVKPVNTVRIKDTTPNIKVKPLTKAEKAKRAVKRNLGFLGMVGSKSIKDAVGGVPQKLEKATAGAGKGGDAGSGGEVLTGLGKGLKKTTVGNTGVAGLGGIGTKGAGGGKGGYGNTMVASGEGAGISSIAVSSSSLTLEGGLSRYAINATIAKYIAQVRHCYEEHGLKYNPKLEGLVTVNFEINGTGRLNFSKVKKSSLNNKKVEKCITTKMMSWQFPVPKGKTAVGINYPFMLRPVGT
jgi:hypothetical protein